MSLDQAVTLPEARSAAPSPSAEAPGPQERRRTTIAITLGVVLLLVVGAWYVGGQQGFSQIGTGGTNLRLLPKVGHPAPDFAALTLDGRQVRLSDYRGQPVWLNFWGSWCPPCRAEFPDLQAAYVEYLQPNGVALLAVSLDEPPQAAVLFAWRNKGTFTILSDPDRSATGPAYPIANFPTHILIDRDGIVRDIVLSAGNKEEIVARAGQIVAPGEPS